ncbi:collagen-like protein [Pleurocapsales cyanobacterium LEGE 06147]|nr:collagen-like protein [Pleurocapsales cyanobacterium LEGE 06147]
MQVRFLSQLSLFLAIFTFPQLLISNGNSIFCSAASWGAEIMEFGQPGQDGEPANKGKDGQDSDNLTVFADGSPMTIDLSGENGFPGEDGIQGKDGICEEQPENASQNLHSSDGGNGGDGGDGGNGGNGGSLTVYATDKSYLKQIQVVARGGEGGEPGKGGKGGIGCKCNKSYWNQEVCTGKPGSSDYSCTTKEFKCQDGYDGRDGRNGRKGRDGNLGTLTLINLDKPLVPDRPSATVTVADLKDRGFTLSRNEWENRTGAASLFAPGSIIAARYTELVKRVEQNVLLVWDAPQPVSNFADRQVTLSLAGEKNVQITFPKDVWLETTTIEQNNITEFFVFNAVLEKDVTRLNSQGLSGNGTNLKLNLVDIANKSDLVLTEFSKIRYRVTRSAQESRYRQVFDYKTIYEGSVPSELVDYNRNTFALHLGQLPIPPEYLQPGVAVEVQLIANRSFADNSKEQRIAVREIIPK